MKNLIFIFLLIPFAAFSQVIDVDVSDYCRDQLEKVDGFNCNYIPNVVVDKTDDAGKKWKLRFHFGFSTTDYYKTDVKIKTDMFDVVVKDIEVEERSGIEHYNPKEWTGAKETFALVHEPTNTFAFSLEKGKNNFYLTIFHPKYLKSIAYKETVVDGETHYDFKDLEDNLGTAEVLYNTAPELEDGYKRIYFQNTHHNAVWQIGYGRQIPVFNSKFGKLTYIPKADIGGNSGKARSVTVGKLYEDEDRVQGYNFSIGHRLEFQKGAISLFIDHKILFSNIETGFLDGKINYNLISAPLTFGVGIDIFTKKKKRN
jgi:hypothetical protein